MRILIWNIKFFTNSRIVGQTATSGGVDENRIRTKNDASRAMQSLSYIRTTVSRIDPDVFVVVEPRSNAGDPGTLADSTSGGPAGLITLLASLRASVSDQWWLVPPQRINSTRTDDPIDPGSPYTECIGVYWRADRMTFTGPWHNTADGPRPPTVGTAIDYTGAWANVVPAGTQAAGRTLFWREGATNYEHRVGFPEQTSRIPFCTTFTERGGQQRLLELYSCHMDTYERGRALVNLLKLPFAEADKKVTVIGGDMNVNVSEMTTYDATAIGELDVFFNLLYPGPEVPVIGRPSRYAVTVVKPGRTADAGDYLKQATYDWGLVHYSTNAFVSAPTCEVINRVAGTPIARAMSNALTDFTRMESPLSVGTFRDRINYGKIGEPSAIDSSPAVLADGTSDHLPILLTV